MITPFIPENKWSFFEKFIFNIKENSDKADIVVNDYGVLEYITDSDLSSHFNIYLGRLLSYSYSEIPYYDYIIKKEIESTQEDNKKNILLNFEKIVSQNGFYNIEKMNYLRKYNVCGIEANNITGLYNDLLEKIRESGWKVNIIEDQILMSVSRACQYSKHLNLLPPDCASSCDSILTLKLKDISTMWGKDSFDIGKDYKFFPELLYKNNITYINNKYELGNSINCDCLVSHYNDKEGC